MSKRPPTWIVEVTGEEPDDARNWTLQEIGDMTDQYGEDTEELAEALGPPSGFQDVQVYGPYTERQARKLAERLNAPAARERLKIAMATPLEMRRFFDPMVSLPGRHA